MVRSLTWPLAIVTVQVALAGGPRAPPLRRAVAIIEVFEEAASVTPITVQATEVIGSFSV